MRAVVVRQKIKPEHLAEHLELIRYHSTGSMTEEEGCLRFDVVQSDDDPTLIFLYELYRDQAAIEAHVETERFKRVVATIANWFAEPEQVNLCDTLQTAEDFGR